MFTPWGPEAGVDRPGQAQGPESGVDRPRSEDAHVVTGHLATRLATVTSLHASKVAEAMRQTMSIEAGARIIVEAVFPRCVVAANADLHLSNEAAERQQRAENPPGGAAASTAPRRRRVARWPWTRLRSLPSSTWG